jgi:hypothetical protein
MGVYVVLVDHVGREPKRIPDPTGGSFDAAGDFDRLLDLRPDLPLWSSIDQYGDTTLSASRMDALLRELEQLLGLSVDGPERRGLERLHVMAALCRDTDGMSLLFVGD